MRPVIAYAAGVAAAAALPVGFLVLTAALSGGFSSRYGIGLLVWVVGIALGVAVIVAVPTLLLLHLLRAVRWLWIGVAGYVTGFALYGAFLMFNQKNASVLPLTRIDILLASTVAGAVAWICASVCWFTIRHLTRPNNSLERTREG
jgi:hypothetical protein